MGNHSCTAEERNSVMKYVLGAINYEFIIDDSDVATTGIVSIDGNGLSVCVIAS